MFNRILFLIQLLYFLFNACNSAIVHVPKDDPDSIVWCPVGSYISSLDYVNSPYSGFFLLSARCRNPATQQTYDLKFNVKPCRDREYQTYSNLLGCYRAYGFMVQRSSEEGSIKNFQPNCAAPFTFGYSDLKSQQFGRSGRCPYNLVACGLKIMRENKRDCKSNLTHFSFACCEDKP